MCPIHTTTRSGCWLLSCIVFPRYPINNKVGLISSLAYFLGSWISVHLLDVIHQMMKYGHIRAREISVITLVPTHGIYVC